MLPGSFDCAISNLKARFHGVDRAGPNAKRIQTRPRRQRLRRLRTSTPSRDGRLHLQRPRLSPALRPVRTAQGYACRVLSQVNLQRGRRRGHCKESDQVYPRSLSTSTAFFTRLHLTQPARGLKVSTDRSAVWHAWRNLGTCARFANLTETASLCAG